MARIVGDNNANRLNGTELADYILGLAGNDSIDGRGGDDVIIGGAGNDEIDGDAGNDRLQGRLGNDHIDGGAGNDRLLGQNGKDLLHGESGNDYILGGLNNDTIDGGKGDDILVGGRDRDTFVFTGDSGDYFGRDTIQDFTVNIDKLNLDDLGVSYAEVTSRTSQSGDNTVINLGSMGHITLLNVDAADLDRADFIL